ncbi:MAG: alkaline phosphatase D family protein [Microthrixaceae bacterium]
MDGPFKAGVASGDPRPSAATIWTRVVPPTGTGPLEVSWTVAADPGLTDVAAAGTATATAGDDHGVHVEVTDLDPDRHWYYRFSVDGEDSPVGRTRTAPAPGSSPERLRLAFLSCQMFSEGYFNTYRHLLDEDVDLMLHLGDYIYEYGSEGEYGYHRLRTDPVDHPTTLEGFRSKYRLYRTDPDLRAAHQQLPMVAMWDDHEVYDDYDRNVDPVVRSNAYRAWFEHMPHVPADPTDPTRLYRHLGWGDLADLVLIDLAQYRQPEAPAPFLSTTPEGAVAHEPGRSILGDAQRAWLTSTMAQSKARWRILGNPQMISPLRMVDVDTPELRTLFPDLPRNAGVYLNGTQWDGYQSERRQILESLVTDDVRDNIVLTGDIHSWWVSEVPLDMDDPASPVVASEFVGGSVTSPSFEDMVKGTYPPLSDLVRQIAGTFEYVNLFDHGYGIAEITRDSVEVSFRKVDIVDPGAGVETLARFSVQRGSPTISRLAATP